MFFILSFVVCCFFGCDNPNKLATISSNLTNYQIDLNFNNENKSSDCSETVTFVNNTNSVLKILKFHLYPKFFEEDKTDYIVSSTHMNQAYPNGKDFAEFNITRVTENDKDLSFSFEGTCDDILVVTLNNSVIPNNIVSINIDFNFKLANICHRFGYGENTINIANFYPVLCVYENGEFSTSPYNANGDPFYSDIANYDVTISTDDDLVIATSGVQTNNHYIAKAVRDFALVLSKNFEVLNQQVNKTNISYYYFNDNEAEKSLRAGVDAIKTFSSMFGEFPYKNFNIVQTDFVYGGMEYPNLIIISSSIENKDDYLNVIVHETAHQWWYSMVGNDEFNYPWLDEGLTEYSTILFYDYNEGYNLNHKDMVDANKDNFTMFYSVYTDVLGTLDTSMRAVDEFDTEPEYTYCTYVKGVLMFDSLYQILGEKTFINCLKTYFREYQFKNSTPENLIESFSKTSKKDLNNFFSSWIEGKVIIR